MVMKSNSLPKAIFVSDTPNNKFASNASKIKPEEGKYDVALHGSDKFTEFLVNQLTRTHLQKSSRATLITKGILIRLFSCNTGNSFAQISANELNTTVHAPTDLIYVNYDGSFYIGERSDGK